MKKFLTLAAAVAAMGFASANAATFVFKGDGGLYDSPTGNVANDCGSLGVDLCTANDALGFDYSKSGIAFNVKGYANGVAAQLIQDINPNNSGLGVLSEADPNQDQSQFDTGEVIEFIFNQVVSITNIEFNAGNDTDCSTPGIEGPCGQFELIIDGGGVQVLTALDLVAGPLVGTKFRIIPITPNAGFAIAQFTVNAANVIPVPAALPLLLAGIAGLGFASRRNKKAA